MVSLEPVAIEQLDLSGKAITRIYRWEFNKIQWEWELEVPELLYDYFKKMPRKDTKDYSIYITNPFDNIYIDKMVSEIGRVAKLYGLSERDKVEFAAAFVQSVPYSLDSETTAYSDYPRYPIETLWEMTGDCEDKSILLASLLGNMGVRTALIHFPKTDLTAGHYGIGISGIQGAYGTRWEHNGVRYYYLETIMSGMRIGAIPGIWANVTPEIQELTLEPFIICDWSIIELRNNQSLEITAQNLGMLTANDIYISVHLDDVFTEYNQLYTFRRVLRSPIFNLKPDNSTAIELPLPGSIDLVRMLSVHVMHDGSVIERDYPS